MAKNNRFKTVFPEILRKATRAYDVKFGPPAVSKPSRLLYLDTTSGNIGKLRHEYGHIIWSDFSKSGQVRSKSPLHGVLYGFIEDARINLACKLGNMPVIGVGGEHLEAELDGANFFSVWGISIARLGTDAYDECNQVLDEKVKELANGGVDDYKPFLDVKAKVLSTLSNPELLDENDGLAVKFEVVAQLIDECVEMLNRPRPEDRAGAPSEGSGSVNAQESQGDNDESGNDVDDEGEGKAASAEYEASGDDDGASDSGKGCDEGGEGSKEPSEEDGIGDDEGASARAEGEQGGLEVEASAATPRVVKAVKNSLIPSTTMLMIKAEQQAKEGKPPKRRRTTKAKMPTIRHECNETELTAEQVVNDYDVQWPGVYTRHKDVDYVSNRSVVQDPYGNALVRATDNGSVFYAPHRLHVDGKIFRARPLDAKGWTGGTVLFDLSGSMHVKYETILKMLKAAPYRTEIYGYKGKTNGHNGLEGNAKLLVPATHAHMELYRGPYGWLIKLADHKECIEEEFLKFKVPTTFPGGYNMIDGPALEWVVKNCRPPYVWVSDMYVHTGSHSADSNALILHCQAICKDNNILRAPTLMAFEEYLTSGDKRFLIPNGGTMFNFNNSNTPASYAKFIRSYYSDILDEVERDELVRRCLDTD